MKILIISTAGVFEVRVLNDQGVTTRKFTYGNLQQARRAADAWSAAYGNCQIFDQTEGQKP
jgi:hypothetical protein